MQQHVTRHASERADTTPSEYVQELVRRDIALKKQENDEIAALLIQSLKENKYSLWTGKDLDDLYAIADGSA